MPLPRMPAIGEYVRGAGTLVEIIEVDPPPIPPPTHDYVFEEIAARCELRLGKDVLKTFNGVWDFYGKGTSVEDAIAKAQRYAELKNIGPGSEVEVVAIKVTHRVRKRPTGNENVYSKGVLEFAALNHGCCAGMPDDVEEVVWSSRNSISPIAKGSNG